MSNIVAYSLIIGTVLGVGFFFMKKDSRKYSVFTQLITVFGGAFLLAVCFLNLIPHIYECSAHECEHNHTSLHIRIGIFVLLGFLIQQLLDILTKGVEHGHLHTHEVSKNTVYGLLVGVCIHAFLEGMPIVYGNNQLQVGLVWGIIVHNIPITVILVSLFTERGYSLKRSMLLLALFAIMTPLGSLLNRVLLIENNPLLGNIIMAIVVGILLHVSISILFLHENNNRKLKIIQLFVIIAAFIIAYLLPTCTH